MRYFRKFKCFGIKKEVDDRTIQRNDVRAGKVQVEGTESEACSASMRLVGCGTLTGTEVAKTTAASLSSTGFKCCGNKKAASNKGVKFLVIGGLLSLFLGCITIIWTPLNFALSQRLRMMPGLPPYDWWVTPPDEVFLRLYVFNITNREEFLSGADSKLKFQEVGPFVFLEKLYHENVTFNNNGTMTYTARRVPIFRPELTNIDMNETLVVPNLAVLGMASYLHDASFFTRFGYNMLMRQMHSQPIITISIDDYLWNCTDPLLYLGRKMVPSFVPLSNIGIMQMIYSDFTDEVTVYIGPDNARKFFTMDRYHGSPRFGYWENETCDAVYTATEGVTYHQSIMKNDSLNYFRKTICRGAPIFYVGDELKNGFNAYRFELPEDFFDRTNDPKTDCFIGDVDYPLQSGLSDVSPCYFGFPIAASAPHFCDGDPSLIDTIEGMTPKRSKHSSYVIVEPITGIPLESCARIQSNLVIRHISSMQKLKKFSDIVIPMFWAEYHQIGIPSYVHNLMYFVVIILPDLQSCGSFLAVAIGGIMLFAGVLSLTYRHKKVNKLNSYSSLDLNVSTSSAEC